MSEDPVESRLREAVDAFAAEYAPEVVSEAREAAMARAAEILEAAMTKSLLAHATRVMQPRLAAESRPAPARIDDADPPLGAYVYGVVEAGQDVPDGLPGVDPRFAVDVIEHEGLAAITSRVALDEFGEEALHENLNDVEWLEEKARTHEAVLESALERTTVIPMRLCTIYAGEAEVRDMLDREHAVLRDALQRLGGRVEWGAKVVAEAGALEAAVARRSGEPEQEDAPSGTAYMNRRRREANAREDAGDVAEEWALEIHETLSAAASEALLNPLQRSELSGHEGDMILNGVYLVDATAVDDFIAAGERLSAEFRPNGVSVELTGPWPPYNFVKGSIEAAR